MKFRSLINMGDTCCMASCFLLRRSHIPQARERIEITPSGTPTPAPMAASWLELELLEEPLEEPLEVELSPEGQVVLEMSEDPLELELLVRPDRAVTLGIMSPLLIEKGACGDWLISLQIISLEVWLTRTESQQ